MIFRAAASFCLSASLRRPEHCKNAAAICWKNDREKFLLWMLLTVQSQQWQRYYANKVWKRSRTHEAVDSGKLSGTHGDTAKTFYIGSKNSSIYFCLYEKEKEQKSKGIKTDIKNRFEIRLKSGKAEQTIEQLVFSRNPEQTIASLILTQIDFPVYILWDIFLDNVTTSLPFIMTPVAVNMDKTKRWLERQVMPSLLMIKEIEKQIGANYLEEIDRHTRQTVQIRSLMNIQQKIVWQW